MAQLSAVELHALANACGSTEAANLIGAAVEASGTPGVFDSENGAYQIGSNSTDVGTLVGLIKEQASNAVTAHAGGTQAAAIALTSMINRISTVTTAGDSAKLPTAAAGFVIFVFNDGANSAQIFGNGTDTINSIATATGVPLPAGAVAIFIATATGNWRGVILTAPISANTAITTAGAGTLTAAGIVGGVITRSGASAAYSDATDTAVAIVAAIPMVKAGMTFEFVVKNTVGFNETITAGAGVTLSGQTIIPPNSVGRFRVTVTSVTAVAIQGISISLMTTPPLEANTSITTAGAGVLTAAGIVGRLITRSGASADYIDTTDTAANIIAGLPNANVGDAFEFSIKNTVAFTETLAADTGVTLAGLTAVPALSVGRFLVKVTAATTVTITGIGMQPLCHLPAAQFTTIATDTTITAAAGALTGANHVFYQTTAAGAGGIALTTRTAAQMFADIPNAQVGMTFLVTLISQGGGTVTLTDGGQVTITGTATVATKTTRTFECKFTTNAALTMQSVSKGTIE